MLTFSNVDFSYPNQPIFSDLNLQVDPGELLYLIGRSGAGKTTLLQLIYLNMFPQGGSVQFDKYNSANIKSSDLPFLRRKIGVIFQDFKLLEDRNVFSNLSFILQITGTPSKLIKRKVMHALSDVGLSHKQQNMPRELSGGEKQRIAIARAIINEPLLVLADEPTGNLDPETSEEILSILKKINARGTAIILATHNYKLIKNGRHRIIKLTDGKAVKVVLKSKLE